MILSVVFALCCDCFAWSMMHCASGSGSMCCKCSAGPRSWTHDPCAQKTLDACSVRLFAVQAQDPRCLHPPADVWPLLCGRAGRGVQGLPALPHLPTSRGRGGEARGGHVCSRCRWLLLLLLLLAGLLLLHGASLSRTGHSAGMRPHVPP